MNLPWQWKGVETASKIIPRNHQVRNKSIINKLMKEESQWCRLETSEKSDNVFILTLKNSNDKNLLNPSLLYSIQQDLHYAKTQVSKGQVTRGSVLITATEGDHFHHSFDHYKGDSDEPNNPFLRMTDLFKNVVRDLISFPMPTIAAINGSAEGAGLMFGISHDYLTMNSDIGSLRLGHFSTGTKLPPYFTALISSKVGSPLARRSLLLRDSKFAAKREKDGKDAVKIADKLKEEAVSVLDLGIEVAKDGKDALKVAEDLAVVLAGKNWNGEVYAELRKALYPELCTELGLTCDTILPKKP